MEPAPDFYKSLLDSMTDAVYLVGRDGRIGFWNQAAEELTGYTAERVLGSRCSEGLLNHVDGDGNLLCGAGCPLRKTLQDGEAREEELFLKHAEGHRVPVSVRTSPVRNGDGQIVGAVEVFADNSPRIEALRRVRELEVMAYLDGLTELGNRRYAEMAITSRLKEMERYEWTFGLLFIDLDRFKELNDDHGHDVGDELLRRVARTLETSLRPFDFPGRWGGEELVAVVANVDAERLTRVAERFRALVEYSTVPAEAGPVNVTVSIGATLAEKGDTLESIVRRADQLMYRSKAAGRNRVTIG